MDVASNTMTKQNNIYGKVSKKCLVSKYTISLKKYYYFFQIYKK